MVKLITADIKLPQWKAKELLLVWLNEDELYREAADALRETGELAVMQLVELIGYEQDEGTLYKAVQALGDIGDERAVEALEKVYAEDTRPLVKQEAAIALNKIE